MLFRKKGSAQPPNPPAGQEPKNAVTKPSTPSAPAAPATASTPSAAAAPAASPAARPAPATPTAPRQSAAPARTEAPAPARTEAPAAAPAADNQRFTPAQLSALRARSAAVGEVFTMLMRSPGHRNRTLADLEQIVIPALATRQFTVARRTVDDRVVPVGLIIWASVSPAIDAQLSSNLDTPVALKPADWTSGDNVWLVDAVGETRVVAAMINDACATKIKRPIKVRAKDKDGSFKVRVVEPGAVTAGGPAASTPSS